MGLGAIDTTVVNHLEFPQGLFYRIEDMRKEVQEDGVDLFLASICRSIKESKRSTTVCSLVLFVSHVRYSFNLF